MDLAAVEQEKYRRVWAHDVYRKVSPGQMEVESFFRNLSAVPGDTLNDYGAGTGRATAWFRDRGLDVLAVDHVEEALETDVPFVSACLWGMGDSVRVSRWGFCCDVMEHIPPEMVVPVLEGIRDRTEVATYFRVATRPDVMGPRLLGEPLHLTVWPAQAWVDAIHGVFGKVTALRSDGRDLVCVAAVLGAG